MTATTAKVTGKVTGKRRWLRGVLPLAVVLALIAFTITVHVLQQGDPTDKSFLSPTSDADDGAKRLASRLTAAGVQIDRQTDTPGALAAARAGTPATVLVTTPSLVYSDYLFRLRALPAGTRVVLIAPDPSAVSDAGLTADLAGPRWTAAAPEAGCTADFAAGPAAVLRWQYTATYGGTARCYSGGVVELTAGNTTVTLVGAADAFRNDRAGEHANQAFATGLLSRSNRVIWLDLHKHEEPPEFSGGRRGQPDDEATPEPEPGGGDPGDSSDDGNDNQSQGGGPGSGQDDGNGGGGNPLADSPLGQAFPPALWATILLLVLAAAALAAASARRLGAPVAEPLPVRVRAAETVRGLGGLYRRARARDTSLATLQGAAVRRLADHFGMPPDSSTAEVAERVAAYTGKPVDEVRAVLGAAAEGTDRELAQAATAVQDLVRSVTQQQVIDEGNVL